VELFHLAAQRSGPLSRGRPDGFTLTDGNYTSIKLTEQAVGLQERRRQLSGEGVSAWHHQGALGMIEKAVRAQRALTPWESHG
jgi:hypothetical protein